jgi:hypothetical protein
MAQRMVDEDERQGRGQWREEGSGEKRGVERRENIESVLDLLKLLNNHPLLPFLSLWDTLALASSCSYIFNLLKTFISFPVLSLSLFLSLISFSLLD